MRTSYKVVAVGLGLLVVAIAGWALIGDWGAQKQVEPTEAIGSTEQPVSKTSGQTAGERDDAVAELQTGDRGIARSNLVDGATAAQVSEESQAAIQHSAGYRLIVPTTWSVQGHELSSDDAGMGSEVGLGEMLKARLITSKCRATLRVMANGRQYSIPCFAIHEESQCLLADLPVNGTEEATVATLEMLDEVWQLGANGFKEALEWSVEIDSIRRPASISLDEPRFEVVEKSLSEQKLDVMRDWGGTPWRRVLFRPLALNVGVPIGRNIAVGRFVRGADGAGVRLPHARVHHDAPAWRQPQGTRVRSYSSGRFWFDMEAEDAEWPVELVVLPMAEHSRSDELTLLRMSSPTVLGGILDYGDIEFPLGTIEIVANDPPEEWPEGWPVEDGKHWVMFSMGEAGYDGSDYTKVVIDRTKSQTVVGLGVGTNRVYAGLYGAMEGLFRLNATSIESVSADPLQMQRVRISPTWSALRKLTVLEQGVRVHDGFWHVSGEEQNLLHSDNTAKEIRSLRPIEGAFGDSFDKRYFPQYLPVLNRDLAAKNLTLFTWLYQAEEVLLSSTETAPVVVNFDRRTRSVCYRLSMEPLSNLMIQRLRLLGRDPSKERVEVFLEPSSGTQSFDVDIQPGSTVDVVVTTDTSGDVYWVARSSYGVSIGEFLYQFPQISARIFGLDALETCPVNSDGVPILEVPLIPAPVNVIPANHFIQTSADISPIKLPVGDWSVFARGLDKYGNDLGHRCDLPSLVRDGEDSRPVQYELAPDGLSTAVRIDLPARLEVTLSGELMVNEGVEVELFLGIRDVLTIDGGGKIGSSRMARLNTPTRMWAEPGNSVLCIWPIRSGGVRMRAEVPVVLEQDRVKFLAVDLDKLEWKVDD